MPRRVAAQHAFADVRDVAAPVTELHDAFALPSQLRPARRRLGILLDTKEADPAVRYFDGAQMLGLRKTHRRAPAPYRHPREALDEDLAPHRDERIGQARRPAHRARPRPGAA